MEQSEVTFRWNEHHFQLFNDFLQQSRVHNYTDIILANDHERFHAHKLMLMSCSTYIEDLISQTPCESPVIFLRNIPSNYMKLILQYIYKGSFLIKQGEIKIFLKIASTLKIEGSIPESLTHSPNSPTPLIINEQKNHSQALINLSHKATAPTLKIEGLISESLTHFPNSPPPLIKMCQ